MYDEFNPPPSLEVQRAHRRAAILWAAEVLADPDVVLLDTETTGKARDSRIVEIAVASPAKKKVLLDTRLNPGIPIPPGSTRVHGITDTDVEHAPAFADIVPQLTEIFHGRRVVIYNAPYDTAIISNELLRHFAAGHADGAEFRVKAWYSDTGSRWDTGDDSRLDAGDCAMRQAAAFIGKWNDYHGNYAWHRLENLVPDADHSALGDVRATWKVVTRIARTRSDITTIPPTTTPR